MTCFVDGTNAHAIVARLAEINDRISVLEQEAKDCKAWLIENVGKGSHVFGSLKLNISRGRRFDPDLAIIALPAEWLDKVVRPQIDAALARRVLPPALYQSCQLESENYTLRMS